jgi:hypothetical protein
MNRFAERLGRQLFGGLLSAPFGFLEQERGLIIFYKFIASINLKGRLRVSPSLIFLREESW